MIDEKALRAAFAVNHHPDSEPSETELAKLRRSILAYESAKAEEAEGLGSERLAMLVEEMINESPYDHLPQSRMALSIAADVVRRGRHLTGEEKMRNLVNALEAHGPLPDHIRAELLRDR